MRMASSNSEGETVAAPRFIHTNAASTTKSALTSQTCVGFALTTLSIWLIPAVAGAVGWRWAFASLAVGPFLGVAAMARLRGLPEARLLAGGRR